MSRSLSGVPYGEVFVEERNNSWSTPYKFNGKELDEETGLYYYGARYYDPRTSVWVSVDPLAEKYPNISSYVYCADNPVKYVDPDGRELYIVGTKAYRSQVLKDIRILSSKPEGRKLIQALQTKNVKVFIKETNGRNYTDIKNSDKATGKVKGGSDSDVYYDTKEKGEYIKNTDGSKGRKPLIGLAHELGHAKTAVDGTVTPVYDEKNMKEGIQKGDLIKVHDPDVDRDMYMYKDEINVRKEVDNPIRKEQGEKLRPMPKKLKVK